MDTASAAIAVQEPNEQTEGGKLANVSPSYIEPRFTLQPTTFEEALQFSRLIADSGMVPESYRGKPGDILVAVQMGAEVGLKAMQALQSIAVIKGRPTLWGDGMLAIVRANPICEFVVEEFSGEGDQAGWTCTAKRRGDPNLIVNRFTIADAKAAGLWNKEGPWRSYGANRMCKMRARSWTCRDGFADILRGMQVHEEVRDIPDSADVQAVRSAPTRTLALKAALGAIVGRGGPKTVTESQSEAPASAVATPAATARACGEPPAFPESDFRLLNPAQTAARVAEVARENGISDQEVRDIAADLGGKLTRKNAADVIKAIRQRGAEAREAAAAMAAQDAAAREAADREREAALDEEELDLGAPAQGSLSL